MQASRLFLSDHSAFIAFPRNPTYDSSPSPVGEFIARKSAVRSVAKSRIGEVNLDGEFDFGDLVSVFTAGE